MGERGAATPALRNKAPRPSLGEARGEEPNKRRGEEKRKGARPAARSGGQPRPPSPDPALEKPRESAPMKGRPPVPRGSLFVTRVLPPGGGSRGWSLRLGYLGRRGRNAMPSALPSRRSSRRRRRPPALAARAYLPERLTGPWKRSPHRPPRTAAIAAILVFFRLQGEGGKGADEYTPLLSNLVQGNHDALSRGTSRPLCFPPPPPPPPPSHVALRRVRCEPPERFGFQRASKITAWGWGEASNELTRWIARVACGRKLHVPECNAIASCEFLLHFGRRYSGNCSLNIFHNYWWW